MEREQNGLTIGAVAKAAGVNVETVRFYQRRALLPSPTGPMAASGAMRPRTSPA
jgi:MerR family mercuric resistance operon transcriptional regulator